METMQAICRRLICNGKTIRLVPTMGSLHAGHASLIKRAIEDKAEPDVDSTGATQTTSKPLLNGSIDHFKQSNNETVTAATTAAATATATNCSPMSGDASKTSLPLTHCANVIGSDTNDKPVTNVIVIVSIFVNPLQFNDSNDFAKYPITREQDLALCKQLQVDYVFMPQCQDILGHSVHGKSSYSSSSSTSSFAPSTGCTGGKESSRPTAPIKYGRSRACNGRCSVKPPDELARDLEGKSRGNHFEGMLTIVCKLFNVIQPDVAYFGEKDYQQLVLVKKMVRDLSMRVRVCPVETVRDTGTMLPLSSRNVRLNREQQQLAATLMFGALMNTKQALEDKCKRSIYDDRNGGDSPPVQLDTILLASSLAAQCLISSDEEFLLYNNKNHVDEDTVAGACATSRRVTVDYFELRCANDLTVIEFDQTENLYNCQMGCCSGVNLNDNRQDGILRARLLISIIVANVRLLDNIEIQLNL